MTSISAPSRPTVSAAAAWRAADREFVRHQRVCRLYQAGRFCRVCDRLDSRTMLTARAYGRALDVERGA